MRLRILSRASDLARLQSLLVERAIRARFPEIDITLETRASAGDRDRQTPLWQMGDKGAFTSDLSEALVRSDADLVVHSWKDLPLEGRAGTVIAATLERADPRDVVLVRREVVDARPSRLLVLSSSPRRAAALPALLPELLPWRVDAVEHTPVRGNVPTRLAKLAAGQGDALVVAKAALDRLLSFGAPFDEAARAMRGVIDRSAWMVLPLRDCPAAPAQGALAIEIASGRRDLADRLGAISHQPTWQAVEAERAILQSYGGGCHSAIGATVLIRDYGRVTSVRADLDGRREERWSLESTGSLPPPVDAARVWPRPGERERVRRAIEVAPPAGGAGLFVTRAEALPEQWRVSSDRFVWASGGRTWRRLAARGVWVHGCSDGLGDAEPPALDALAGRAVDWQRLTHRAVAAGEPDAMATYEVDQALPDDLGSRTHFFWSSGTEFLTALERCPSIREGWHGTGPGRTWRAVRGALGPEARVRVWLDYDAWRKDVCP